MPLTRDRLHLAPEVIERLPESQVSRVYDLREHTELRCIVCGGWILPESDEVAEVIISEDPGQGILVNFTHASCRPSGVVRRKIPDPPVPMTTTWLALVRRHAMAATLLWEPATHVTALPDDEAPFDPIARRLRASGFRTATDKLTALVAPVAKDWHIRQHGADLLLRAPDGSEDEFNNALPLPPGWYEAARKSRRVLVVYGSGLGLDRPSTARINRALQAGVALVALVPWTTHRP